MTTTTARPDAAVVDFERFVTSLVDRVPGLPPHALPTFDLTRQGMLDHFQRTAVRRAASAFAPEVDPTALEACGTLGELYEVVGDGAGSEKETRGAYVGQTVRLRAVVPDDYAALYRASFDPASSFRWRFRGVTPSPSEFEDSLFAGVLAQLAVVDRHDDSLHGLVSAYDHRPDVGSVRFAFQRAGEDRPRQGGELVEGAFLFIDYLFTTFNLRRVRLELPEYNEYLVRGLDVLEREGELREYLWYNGRYWSMLLLSIERESWNELASPFFGGDIRPGSERPE